MYTYRGDNMQKNNEPNTRTSETEPKGNERIQELLNLSEKMLFRRSPKWSDGTAYFYFTTPDGITQEDRKVDIDEKRFKMLRSEMVAKMKQTFGKAYLKLRGEQETEREQRNKDTKEKQGNIVRISEAMKQYDRSFAAQMLLLAKNQQWFTEIIEQLGITTLFMILQVAHIPAEQWYNKIKEYKDDPEAFLRWADSVIVALYEAKEDAEKILEIRNKYYNCIAERESLRAELIRYKALLQEALTNLNAATSMLNKKQMQKYTLWIAMRRMSEIQPVVYIEEEKGEKKSEAAHSEN